MLRHRPRMYLGWLLGTSISETIADTSRNETPVLQDGQSLYTTLTMTANSAMMAARRARQKTALRLIKLPFTPVAEIETMEIDLTQQGEDSNGEFLSVLCLEV